MMGKGGCVSRGEGSGSEGETDKSGTGTVNETTTF
jgi:hypothetical protein